MSDERVGSVYVNISARLDDFRKGLDEAKTKLDRFQKQTHQNFQRMAGGSKQSSINLSKMVVQAGKLAVGLRFVNNALDAIAKNQLVVGDGFDAWEEKVLNTVRIIPILGDMYANMYEKAKAISPFNSQNILQQKRDQERFRKEVSEARLRDQNELIVKETEALQKNIKTSTVRMKFETDVSLRGEDALDSKRALVGLDRDKELSKIEELKKSLYKGFKATLFLDTRDADKAIAEIEQTISDATDAVNKKHEERLNLLDREKDLRLHNIALSERLKGVEMERGALQRRQQLNYVRSLEFKAQTQASARGEDVRTPDVIHKEKKTRVDEDIASRRLEVEKRLIQANADLELEVDTETKKKLQQNAKDFGAKTFTETEKQANENKRRRILERAEERKLKSDQNVAAETANRKLSLKRSYQGAKPETYQRQRQEADRASIIDEANKKKLELNKEIAAKVDAELREIKPEELTQQIQQIISSADPQAPEELTQQITQTLDEAGIQTPEDMTQQITQVLSEAGIQTPEDMIQEIQQVIVEGEYATPEELTQQIQQERERVIVDKGEEEQRLGREKIDAELAAQLKAFDEKNTHMTRSEQQAQDLERVENRGEWEKQEGRDEVDRQTEAELKALDEQIGGQTPIQRQRQEAMRNQIIEEGELKAKTGNVTIRNLHEELDLLERERVAKLSIIDSDRKDYERKQGQSLDTRLKHQSLSGDDKKLELAFSQLQERFKSELERMGGLSMTDENADKLKLFYEREGEKLAKSAKPQAMAGHVQSGLGSFQVGVDPVATKTSDDIATFLENFKTFVENATTDGIKIQNESFEEG